MKFLNILGASAASILTISVIASTQAAVAQAQPATAPAAPTAPAATATEAPAQEMAAGDAVKGKATFEGRCTRCHAEDDIFAPAPAVLATYSPERIREALTTGLMVKNAVGMTDSDISNVVAYLATQPKSAS